MYSLHIQILIQAFRSSLFSDPALLNATEGSGTVTHQPLIHTDHAIPVDASWVYMHMLYSYLY